MGNGHLPLPLSSNREDNMLAAVYTSKSFSRQPMVHAILSLGSELEVFLFVIIIEVRFILHWRLWVILPLIHYTWTND